MPVHYIAVDCPGGYAPANYATSQLLTGSAGSSVWIHCGQTSSPGSAVTGSWALSSANQCGSGFSYIGPSGSGQCLASCPVGQSLQDGICKPITCPANLVLSGSNCVIPTLSVGQVSTLLAAVALAWAVAWGSRFLRRAIKL